MQKKFLSFSLLAMISTFSYADILLPTFYAHAITRVRFGEQQYRSHDQAGILWQLNYWSHKQLQPAALSQALNDVIADRGKCSGTVKLGDLEYQLYHSSAGKGDKTATLFFIVEGELSRIIGIAKHVQVQPCLPPKYEKLAWDDRYIID